jgi:hypothetical protein
MIFDTIGPTAPTTQGPVPRDPSLPPPGLGTRATRQTSGSERIPRELKN